MLSILQESCLLFLICLLRSFSWKVVQQQRQNLTYNSTYILCFGTMGDKQKTTETILYNRLKLLETGHESRGEKLEVAFDVAVGSRNVGKMSYKWKDG